MELPVSEPKIGNRKRGTGSLSSFDCRIFLAHTIKQSPKETPSQVVRKIHIKAAMRIFVFSSIYKNEGI